MNEIKIKCPDCGKILRLADKPNINNAVFTCPVCNGKHRVGDCPRMMNAPKQSITSEETQYGTSQYSPSNAEETQIAGATQAAKIGHLVDNYGRSYQLSIGINTIGRKAYSSTASVQIDVNDRTMSRSHAIIEVKNVGGQIMHILRNGANKNPSFLNGALLESSDQLILNNGNSVKFGDTVLIFKSC